MSCGAPVVTSNISSMPEVAGDAAFLINPGNVAELLNVMIDIVENKDVQIKMKSDGINQAKIFSWEKTAFKTINLYNYLSK
jgi:glycosyltransferase involved in cell wall biosynthesis